MSKGVKMKNISAIFAESIAKKYKVQAADKWKEEKPKECDLCHKKFSGKDNFVDGRLKTGPWGILCEKCHKAKGMGLGVGFGQKYSFKTLEKIKEEEK